MIYLDNAATTFPKPERVYEAQQTAMRQQAFNAGRGSYKAAREATKYIDETKRMILSLVHAQTGSVVLTPSVTIALNEILQGVDLQREDYVYVSPYEHNAVARTLHLIEKKKGIRLVQMPVTGETKEIDLGKLQYLFVKHPPRMVCCTHVSNVTGYILPVKEIFDLAAQYQAITVLDTAQSLGLVDMDVRQMKLDFLAFAGHKTLYGPLGIGGFIDFGNVPLTEYITGGTGSDSLNLDMPHVSPDKLESASTNIVAVMGLRAALQELDVAEHFRREKELLDYLIEQLQTIASVTLYLPPGDRHIGMVSFNIEGYLAQDIGMILDEDYDIAVRTGYHCAPFVHDMIGDREYLGTVRVGIGRFNTKEDVEQLVEALRMLDE